MPTVPAKMPMNVPGYLSGRSRNAHERDAVDAREVLSLFYPRSCTPRSAFAIRRFRMDISGNHGDEIGVDRNPYSCLLRYHPFRDLSPSERTGDLWLSPPDDIEHARRRPKILVVDSHEEVRLVLGILLEQEGYEVIEVASGGDAIRQAKGQPPDVILLSVSLPDIDGYTVLELLKDEPATRAIPVIMVTGFSDSDSRRRSTELGAVQHVSKPWQVGEIEAAVAAALSKPSRS